MKMKLIAATLFALATTCASAADQSVAVTTTPLLDTDNHFIGVTSGLDGLLSGGQDVITFTGLASGKYKFDVTLSGQNVVFDPLSTLNGIVGTAVSVGSASFEYIGIIDKAPFTLNLLGVAGPSKAIYSGDVTVTAVPEPATYGMLAGGLGLLALVSRRKSASRKQ